MIELLVLKGILCLLSGLFNSGCDTMKDHMSVSRFRFWNPKFWDPKISWSRKYSLPKWVPDALSDGWHIFKWLFLACLFAGVALRSGFLKWYWDSVFCWTAFYVGFMLGYKGIWLKK
jgi:hypothetical protein